MVQVTESQGSGEREREIERFKALDLFIPFQKSLWLCPFFSSYAAPSFFKPPSSLAGGFRLVSLSMASLIHLSSTTVLTYCDIVTSHLQTLQRFSTGLWRSMVLSENGWPCPCHNFFPRYYMFSPHWTHCIFPLSSFGFPNLNCPSFLSPFYPCSLQNSEKHVTS